MISPNRSWKRFESEEEKYDKFRQWKISKNEAKLMTYKGSYTEKEVECEVIGFISMQDEIPREFINESNIAIIKVNGKLHTIHGYYLAAMQKKDFQL